MKEKDIDPVLLIGSTRERWTVPVGELDGKRNKTILKNLDDAAFHKRVDDFLGSEMETLVKQRRCLFKEVKEVNGQVAREIPNCDKEVLIKAAEKRIENKECSFQIGRGDRGSSVSLAFPSMEEHDRCFWCLMLFDYPLEREIGKLRVDIIRTTMKV